MSKNNWCASLLGIGLVFFVWHIRINPVVDSFLFIPWVGLGFIIVSAITSLNTKDKIELGQKKVWIPLAIISLSISLSGLEALIERRVSFNESLAMMTVGVLIFGVYLSSLKLGKSIFKYMPYVAVIESVSLPIVSYLNGWRPTGGLVSITNYDIATGLIIFSILTSPKRHWWWLSIIGGVGLVFSGSGEAIISGVVLLAVALVSKITWWKWAIPVSAIVATSIILIPLGIFTSVQAPNMQRLTIVAQYLHLPNSTFWQGEKAKADAIVAPIPETKVIDQVLGYRVTHFQLTIPVKPFGYGINLTRFYWGIPHNIVLIIIEQVGILAAIAWLFVIGLGIKNRDTRVVFIGFVSLGLVDHYLFTQAAFWAPALIGSYIGGKYIV